VDDGPQEADNPFERYGLDPREGISAITQRLKELAEDAKDDAERERIRAAWEELTLHPARRLRAALNAHPETRAPLGAPPPLPRLRPVATELTLRDLAATPSAVAALPAAITGEGATQREKEGDAPGVDSDPLF
jgi:hypothetical protein